MWMWGKAIIEKQCDEEKIPGGCGKILGDTYFHFPPLLLSFEVSRPMYVAMPLLPSDVSLSPFFPSHHNHHSNI
jgi:hypothetical protein